MGCVSIVELFDKLDAMGLLCDTNCNPYRLNAFIAKYHLLTGSDLGKLSDWDIENFNSFDRETKAEMKRIRDRCVSCASGERKRQESIGTPKVGLGGDLFGRSRGTYP